MADVRNDGNIRVVWLAAVPADVNAPTVAEMAGDELHDFITPDGVIGFEPDTGEVDNSKLSSTFNTKDVGRVSFSGTMLRFFRQDGVDVAYDTLTYATAGAIAIRRGTAAATAFAAADEVEIYPVTCGETKVLPPENTTDGSYQKFEVPTPITATPGLRAVVAA